MHVTYFPASRKNGWWVILCWSTANKSKLPEHGCHYGSNQHNWCTGSEYLWLPILAFNFICLSPQLYSGNSSSCLFQPPLFVDELSLGWILRTLNVQVEKEKKFHCRLFTSSIMWKIRHFCIMGIHWRQRDVQKKCATWAELLFCFKSIHLLMYLMPSRCTGYCTVPWAFYITCILLSLLQLCQKKCLSLLNSSYLLNTPSWALKIK